MPVLSSPTPAAEIVRERIRSSALWAAYGDALGFICELADSKSVQRRAGHYPVDTTVPWKRRVGGRGGPTVELPAGCLSDDTQLRLAVSRCLSSDGFDAQTFAKVELTVWPSYALGAGRGSKAAAAHLGRRDTSWSTNFFDSPQSRYIDGGGNGAAMRIQPHVWASPIDRSTDSMLTEVFVDTVCTHGHPRGLLGAGLHALALRHALLTGTAPGPDQWLVSVADLASSAELIADHDELGGLWLGMWRQRSGRELADVISETIGELVDDINVLHALPRTSVEGEYRSAIEALGAFRSDQRGSATKTALLGSWLAWRSADDPDVAIRLAANQLGTDTDSIATMAGALFGATGASPPDGAIADRRYIELEARRMAQLSAGDAVGAFPHPDLRRWEPPRSQSDALRSANGMLAVTGLGPTTSPDDESRAASGKNDPAWRWVELWFGQRILAKGRLRPSALETSATVHPNDAYIALPLAIPSVPEDADDASHVTDHRGKTVHQLTNEAIDSGFDPAIIGQHLIALSDSDEGIERASMYAAIVAKAQMSRRDRRRNGRSSAA